MIEWECPDCGTTYTDLDPEELGKISADHYREHYLEAEQ